MDPRDDPIVRTSIGIDNQYPEDMFIKVSGDCQNVVFGDDVTSSTKCVDVRIIVVLF